jgi:hypothetical protein
MFVLIIGSPQSERKGKQHTTTTSLLVLAKLGRLEMKPHE